MDEFRVNTGDTFADAMIERRLSMSPEFWALVDYLEIKGLLDREEFLEFFSRSAASYVGTITRAHQSQDD